MTDRMTFDTQPRAHGVKIQCVGDFYDGALVHAGYIANLFSNGQANIALSRQITSQAYTAIMEQTPKPYADIAERLLWHREQIEHLTQADYAAKINTKRSAYSLWEAGSHRLSLNGALALRRRFGLSLDFMFEGIDDALPMTLRVAWRDRPLVKNSMKSSVNPD